MSDGGDIDDELGGCELGTKEFWESSYSNEINNYKSHGDIGEIWFDEDSQFRVITWMIKNEIKSESKIVDLGAYFSWQPNFVRRIILIPVVRRLWKWHDVN